jgi:hypothetical protein
MGVSVSEDMKISTGRMWRLVRREVLYDETPSAAVQGEGDRYLTARKKPRVKRSGSD